MASIEVSTPLKRISSINYPVLFQKDPAGPVSAPIDSSNEVNAIHPAYIKKLGFDIQKTNIEAQKIDGTTLENLGMVIAIFSVHNKARKVCFFEETFLLADINMDVILGMLFLTLSNADV